MVPADVDVLYMAALDPELSYRWRFRGHDISRSDFEQQLHQGVMSQFIVEDRRSGLAHGIVVAYEYDPNAKHAMLAFQRISPGTPGAMVDGMFLFLNYVFSRFDLRKIFLEVPAYNSHLIAKLAFCRLESEQKDHFFFAGEFHSQSTYSISRADWRSFCDGLAGSTSSWPGSTVG